MTGVPGGPRRAIPLEVRHICQRHERSLACGGASKFPELRRSVYSGNNEQLLLRPVMRMSALSHFVSWAFVVTCNATAQMPPAGGLIHPGKGLAGVELGSHFSSFETVFPKHPDLDEDYSYADCGGRRVYHWLDLDKRANGVYVYLKNDEIYQLSVQTPRFALSNGIRTDASEKQVKAGYPQGRGYILLGSGAAAVGGKDLTYWVDREQGVAFEFYWYREKKQRQVRAIDIFRRGTDYRPEGCISPPQEWRELITHSQ